MDPKPDHVPIRMWFRGLYIANRKKEERKLGVKGQLLENRE
jgi:hypothetical protein